MSTQNNSQIYIPEITTIAKGAGVVFIGTIIGSVLKYLFELIVARNLGVNLFGVFFLGFAIFKILERVSTLGLHNGVLRYVSIFRGAGDKERIKGTILLSIKVVLFVAGVITIFTIIFSNTISVNIFHNINISAILKIFAIGVIFSAVTEILVFSTQAFQIMKYKVLVRSIFEPGLRMLLVIIFFLLGWKLLGAVFAFVTSIILGTFLAFYYLKKVFPLITKKKINSVYETRSILGFSWPLFFVGFFHLFTVQINTLMLGYFKTSREIGIYGAAHRTAFLILIILESFNSIFAPMIADIFNRRKLEKLENLFKVVTRWIFTICFPVFLIIVFYAKQILSLWGKEYIAGTICLIVLCCAQLINCSTGSVGYIIMMTGRTKINLLNTLFVFIMIITLNLLLIPKYSILGAALSLGIATSLINIIRLIEVYVILKIHPYRIGFLKPLLSGVASLIVLNLLTKYIFEFDNYVIMLIIGSLILLVIYSFFMYLLGIEKEDKVILQKIKSKLIIFGQY